MFRKSLVSFLLVAGFSLPALAQEVEMQVVGSHSYSEFKPILLKQKDVTCYFVSVAQKDSLFVVGKTCFDEMENETTFQVELDRLLPVTYPTKGGEVFKAKVLTETLAATISE